MQTSKKEVLKVWYYVLHPHDPRDKVRVVTRRPNPEKLRQRYGYSEGPFRTIKDVKLWLNWMNIPNERRPKKFRW